MKRPIGGYVCIINAMKIEHNRRSGKQSRIIGKTAPIFVLILAAFMSLTLATPCFAENSQPYVGKVVVIVVDRVGPGDFPSEATPFCYELADKWSFGL
ncbi:MAG: hypothetical protein JW762_06685, partial [Dehalococcoidales bacterium]|nr:hypothetical protein [Dehalococcoidales bacterium]